MKTPPRAPNASDDVVEDETADSLPIRFGRLVRSLRSEAGWSQEEFAFRVGVHRTYVGAIERGEKTVTIETASKIAHASGISLSSLFVELENRENVERREHTPKPCLK